MAPTAYLMKVRRGQHLACYHVLDFLSRRDRDTRLLQRPDSTPNDETHTACVTLASTYVRAHVDK